MYWRTVLLGCCLILYADGFSKYGRTCKDIGCLNSEVCVLAEDPCSYGRSSGCGTYPTCKKKSLVEGSHAEPAPSVPKVTTPKPLPPRNFDIAPNYPPPAPPNAGSNAYAGSSNNGGSSPYGENSPYGGSSPYGGNSQGGGSPYGGSNPGSPYGGSNPGSPYGGSNPGSPYGGSNPYGRNSPYGGSSPYGGNRGGSNPYGGNSPYGNTDPHKPSSGFGSGGGSPLDSILNTLNKYANGGGGSSGGSSGSGGSGLSNIFGNILGNISKNGGGLNNLFNTRPIQENPNYSSYSSNSRSSNPQNYPSGTQTQPQNRAYGQNVHHSAATTHKPASYGWNVGVTVFTYLIHQYFQNMIRNYT